MTALIGEGYVGSFPKTYNDSTDLDFGFCAVDSRFFVSGTYKTPVTPTESRIWDSFSWITGSKSQDSGRPLYIVLAFFLWWVLLSIFSVTFLGTNKHFNGKNGTLRWSILVGKQKHNVQKPSRFWIPQAKISCITDFTNKYLGRFLYTRFKKTCWYKAVCLLLVSCCKLPWKVQGLKCSL